MKSKPKKPQEDAPATDERVCYHEAGHAVMNILFCIPFDYVTLLPEELKALGKPESAGLVHTFPETVQKYFDSLGPSLKAHELAQWKRIVGLMSGMQAEHILTNRTPDENVVEGSLKDWEEICHILKCFYSVEPSGDFPVKAVDDLRETYRRAFECLSSESTWPMVCAVAQALAEKRRLTYKQVLSLMEANGWRPPEEQQVPQ